MARYGHQRVHDLLGRDPVEKPLTLREMAFFQAALSEHLRDEFPEAKKEGNFDDG